MGPRANLSLGRGQHVAGTGSMPAVWVASWSRMRGCACRLRGEASQDLRKQLKQTQVLAVSLALAMVDVTLASISGWRQALNLDVDCPHTSYIRTRQTCGRAIGAQRTPETMKVIYPPSFVCPIHRKTVPMHHILWKECGHWRRCHDITCDEAPYPVEGMWRSPGGMKHTCDKAPYPVEECGACQAASMHGPCLC